MVNFREPKCATRLFNNDFSDFLSQVFNETIIQHEKESLVDWCFYVFLFCDFHEFSFDPGVKTNHLL